MSGGMTMTEAKWVSTIVVIVVGVIWFLGLCVTDLYRTIENHVENGHPVKCESCGR